jgi:hypothetical protein
MKSKYEVLDGHLVNLIASGMCRFNTLVIQPEIRAEAFKSVRNPDDVLNGRLQALRKAGKIYCRQGMWFVETQVKSAQDDAAKHDLF